MSRYDNIRKEIKSKSGSFKLYLDHQINEAGVGPLLQYIAEQCNVYVFSGIIRNFLLGYLDNRDIDFVITTDKSLRLPISLLKGLRICKNKFGGIKIEKNGITIDVWDISMTWGFLNTRIKPTPYALLRTSFFNFSSIIFDYNNKRFIFDDNFCRFIKTNTIDVVLNRNPYHSACIISTLHYASAYGFEIGDRLRRWVIKHYDNKADFISIQEKRYGRTIYKKSVISKFVYACKETKEKKDIEISDFDGNKYIITIHKNKKI